MVAFFFPPPSGLLSSAASISYTGGQTSTANQTNYTFASAPIGADATDRMFVIAVAERFTGTTPPTGVTMNGSAMTKISSIDLNSDITLSLWYLPRGIIPTGSTASVVVSNSTGRSMCRIDLWRIVSQSSDTPYWSLPVYNAGFTSLLTFSPTPDLPDGASMAASAAPNANPSYTWVGLTESYDTFTETDNCEVSGATGTGIPATLTATISFPLPGLMGIAATWR